MKESPPLDKQQPRPFWVQYFTGQIFTLDPAVDKTKIV